jgi:hypothetical protein
VRADGKTLEIGAYTTFEGFYALDIPNAVAESSGAFEILLGEYRYLQIEAVATMPIESVRTPDETRLSRKAEFALSGMQFLGGGLVGTDDADAFVRVVVPTGAVARLVFRPLVSREKNPG